MSNQSGWGNVGMALGTLFGGGQDRADAVFRQRLDENAGLGRKMALADIDRMRAMALTGVLSDESVPEWQRNVMAAELGDEFANFEQGNLRALEGDMRQRAVELGMAGNPWGMNVHLAGAHGQPTDVVQLRDGLAFNPLDPRTQPTITPLGESQLAFDQARIATEQARAQELGTRSQWNVAREQHVGRPGGTAGGELGAMFDSNDLIGAIGANAAIRQENLRRQRLGEPLLPEINLAPMIGGLAAPPPATAPPAVTQPATPRAQGIRQLPREQWPAAIAEARRVIREEGRDPAGVRAKLLAMGVPAEEIR